MSNIKLFEEKNVRSIWNEQEEKWYFSITDVVFILTFSIDALAYWRKLKQRLKAEGNETVTNCHGLKMVAADGKMRRLMLQILSNCCGLFNPFHHLKPNHSNYGWLKSEQNELQK